MAGDTIYTVRMKYKIGDVVKCSICGKSFNISKKSQIDGHRKHGRFYCSRDCSKEYCRKISSETMAKTNRKYASDRMKKNNPMKNEKSREKMKATLRTMGHRPPVQGGNGRGATKQQLALSTALGWNMEVVVKTKKPKGSDYPSCYKIDIGNKALKIGVECDGNSHCSLDRQAQDRKKDNLLNSFGWTILRFKNKEIDEDINSCVKKIMEVVNNV